MEFGVSIAHHLVGNKNPITGSISTARTLFLAHGGGTIAKTFIGGDFGVFSKKGDTVVEHTMLVTKIRI